MIFFVRSVVGTKESEITVNYSIKHACANVWDDVNLSNLTLSPKWRQVTDDCSDVQNGHKVHFAGSALTQLTSCLVHHIMSVLDHPKGRGTIASHMTWINRRFQPHDDLGLRLVWDDYKLIWRSCPRCLTFVPLLAHNVPHDDNLSIILVISKPTVDFTPPDQR